VRLAHGKSCWSGETPDGSVPSTSKRTSLELIKHNSLVPLLVGLRFQGACGSEIPGARVGVRFQGLVWECDSRGSCGSEIPGARVGVRFQGLVWECDSRARVGVEIPGLPYPPALSVTAWPLRTDSPRASLRCRLFSALLDTYPAGLPLPGEASYRWLLWYGSGSSETGASQEPLHRRCCMHPSATLRTKCTPCTGSTGQDNNYKNAAGPKSRRGQSL